MTQSSIQKLAFTALCKVQEKTTKINHLSVQIVHQWCQASSEKCKSQTSVFPLEELQYLLAIVAIGKICHYEPSTLLCDISLLSGWRNIVQGDDPLRICLLSRALEAMFDQNECVFLNKIKHMPAGLRYEGKAETGSKI